MIHPSDAELYDFADDEATQAELERIRAHLTTCASCRGTVEGIVRLREKAVRMRADDRTREEALVPDQWPEIEARIRSGVSAGAPDWSRLDRASSASGGGGVAQTAPPVPGRGPRRRGSWGMWPAAAAIVLIGASSAITLLLDRAVARPEEVVEPGTTRISEGAVGDREAAVVAAYAPVMTELEGILAEGRGRLLPETVAVLEENLQVLDAAIEEVRRALAQDPADVGMLRSLDGIYRTRVGMLQRAVERTGRT